MQTRVNILKPRIILILMVVIGHFYLAKAQDSSNALLWKVSDSIGQCAYLFGTMHVIDHENFYMPDTLLGIMDQLDEVCFEIKIDQDPMELIIAMLSQGESLFLPEGNSIRDYLDDKHMVLLQQRVEGSGLPMNMLENLKPIYISTMLSTENVQMSSFVSYEQEIAREASIRNIAICGLETIAQQIEVLNQIKIEDQVKQLQESLEETGGPPKLMDSLVHFYIRQDIEKLDQLIQLEWGMDEERLKNAFLRDRNTDWVITITEDIKLSNLKLYAVGAGHLGGENGLITLLEKQGLTLEPVHFTWHTNGNTQSN